MDYFDKAKGIIYELKPRNSRSIASGVKQLLRYNKEYGNIYKLVLVLY